VAVEAVGFGFEFNGLALETVAVTTLVGLGIKDSVSDDSTVMLGINDLTTTTQELLGYP